MPDLTCPATPEAVAIQENFWTLTIRDLDDIIDRLASRADLFGQSKVMHSASDLRDALDIVRRVRDKHLAENYDANRKGEGVRLV